MAAPSVSVGRMIDTAGNFLLRKMVGSGMMRLVWKSASSGFEFIPFVQAASTGRLSGGLTAGQQSAAHSCHTGSADTLFEETTATRLAVLRITFVTHRDSPLSPGAPSQFAPA